MIHIPFKDHGSSPKPKGILSGISQRRIQTSRRTKPRLFPIPLLVSSQLKLDGEPPYYLQLSYPISGRALGSGVRESCLRHGRRLREVDRQRNLLVYRSCCTLEKRVSRPERR